MVSLLTLLIEFFFRVQFDTVIFVSIIQSKKIAKKMYSITKNFNQIK